MNYDEISKKYPRKIKDLSSEPYFVIYTETSATGGFDQIEAFLEQRVYFDEIEWKAEIINFTNNKTPFRAAKVIPATITTTISVDIR